MTSRQWKDRREKEAFLQQLREFRDETVLSQDLDSSRESLSEAIERQYWEDCRNGLFDDDRGIADSDDDWDLYGDIDDDWNDEPDDCYRYRYYDLDDDLDSPGLNDVTPLPGWHVRLNGVPYLVLRSSEGKWANMLTGEVRYGEPWVDKESVIFGL